MFSLLILFAIFAYFKFQKKLKEIPSALLDFPIKDIASGSVVLSKFSRVQMEDGKLKWKLEAEQGEYSPTTGKVLLKNPNILMFDDESRETSITANSAEALITDSQLITVDASGAVNVKLPDGVFILSEQASYDKKLKTVRSNKATTITSKGFSSRGLTFVGDLTNQKFTLKGGVVTEFYPNK